LVDTELGIFAYTFGDPFIAAVVGGSHEVLTLLLAEDGKKNLLGTSGRKRLLSAAAERGDEQTVLYILQSGYNPLSQPPPRNVEHRTRSWEMTQTTKLLRTPSVEVFETIMDDMESWDRLPLGNTFLAHCLEAAIRNGWADMTRYLITFGTPVDTRFPCASLEDPLYWACKYGRGDVVKLLIDNTRASDNSEVIIYGMNLSIAASRGHSSVVKIILESGGLDPDASHRDVLYAAARKGYLDTVKVLLDAGMDPNAGKIHLPLVGAVESEHTDMFRLLIQQGADVTRALPEATRAAEAAGLDSMLALLSEYRTTEHTNCV
jgi:hypothetical protein